jgi:hypothetical protein
MTDAATLTTRLEEAEAALHTILVGKRAVQLIHGDTQTRFSESNVAELRAYIAELKGELGLTTGRTSARRIVFG